MISVITASIPPRQAMLAECMAAVAAQTLPPLEHLVGIDFARWGSSPTRNALVAGARGDWIAVIDDDDLMYPEHLAKLSAITEADVVYSFCDVTGKAWNPNGAFDEHRLRGMNYIPITSLIRTDLLRSLGGWRDSSACQGGLEDWDLWIRALDAGARFACVEEVTWLYRFHGGNKSVRGEAEAA